MIMNVNKVVVACNQEWSLRVSVSIIIYISVFLSVQWDLYTPNANMADLSVGPGLVARKRG